MKTGQWIFALSAIMLLVLSPLAAGCLSVPGPESQKKTPTITAAVTRSPQATTPATTAVQRTAMTTVTIATAAATTTPATIATTGTMGNVWYAPATCTERGGFLVLPGQQCPGTWLAATNTFSCCSVKPVTASGGDRVLTAVPFTMTVNIDDNLGSIQP